MTVKQSRTSNQRIDDRRSETALEHYYKPIGLKAVLAARRCTTQAGKRIDDRGKSTKQLSSTISKG